MSLMTGPVGLWLRGQARRLGLNGVIGGLLAREGYEAAYWRAMAEAISAGDCVWDIGANRGYYAERFADLVGARGRVLAFEPSARNFTHLREAIGDRSNVALFPIGLSSTSGEVALVAGEDALGATTRVARGEPESAGLEKARLERGDTLIASGRASRPNVLKVDVEGHEGEVFEGMQATLRDPALRAVFVEMHFGVLAEQNRSQVPREIEALLRRSGFDLRWTDASHLHAFRSKTRSPRAV